MRRTAGKATTLSSAAPARTGSTGDSFRSPGDAPDVEGADRLDGGSGDDRLFGERGEDDLNGGRGADRLFGGRENDLLDAGPGKTDDKIHLGGPGFDICRGKPTRRNGCEAGKKP
jgi:Ca2+-binding RTX toxin-like protein